MTLREKVTAIVIEHRNAGRMSEDIADAAIDAVFDHLMEPSETMRDALTPSVDADWVESYVEGFKAVLTQARKEASK